MNSEILNINGVDCYEQDGTAYLKLEDVARGLGFTTTAASGNEVVRWNTVYGYLVDLNTVAGSCNGKNYKDNCPLFIPENIFYRLAMKAKNEAAERFQATIADEVIPSIRKNGAYLTAQKAEEIISNPDTIIALAQQVKSERAEKERLAAENILMLPKAQYYDLTIERNGLTNIRNTAKLLGIAERLFTSMLEAKGIVYRDNSRRIIPNAQYEKKGYFRVKEFTRGSTNGVQTLVTAQGRAYLAKKFGLIYSGESAEG